MRRTYDCHGINTFFHGTEKRNVVKAYCIVSADLFIPATDRATGGGPTGAERGFFITQHLVSTSRQCEDLDLPFLVETENHP